MSAELFDQVNRLKNDIEGSNVSNSEELEKIQNSIFRYKKYFETVIW